MAKNKKRKQKQIKKLHKKQANEIVKTAWRNLFVKAGVVK